MSQRPHYSMAIQWSDEDEVYIVSFPEWEAHGLIGHTHGDTYDQAVKNGVDMLHMLIASALKEGEILPSPNIFGTTTRAG